MVNQHVSNISSPLKHHQFFAESLVCSHLHRAISEAGFRILTRKTLVGDLRTRRRSVARPFVVAHIREVCAVGTEQHVAASRKKKARPDLTCFCAKLPQTTQLTAIRTSKTDVSCCHALFLASP